MNLKTTYSPRGANANFSMGMSGETGGFALQQSKLSMQDVYIGYKEGETVYCLPYSKLDDSNKEAFAQNQSERKLKLRYFNNDEIVRNQHLATDSYKAGKLEFEIMTPVDGIPNPDTSPSREVKYKIAPSIIAKLTIDNRMGKEDISAFFGVGPTEGKYILDHETNGDLVGIASLNGYAFATLPSDNVQVFGDFNVLDLYERPEILEFLLAPMGGININVPAGEIGVLDIAFAWYAKGIVTAGIKKAEYYYTNYFSDIKDVLFYTLDNYDKYYNEAKKHDKYLESKNLNKHRKFLFTQAIRSYYASTMLFDWGGRAEWVVNEGSFMMLNTFDLTIDHLFFELDKNPWVVKSQLNSFADDYSYYDKVHHPDYPDQLFDGGISFTHDQGVGNVFSQRHYSSYEVKNQKGCWSYMTQEQLCNFILCSAMYIHKTSDFKWLKKRQNIIKDCLISMQNRDHFDPDKRDGVMDLDSDRCGKESEITTYDSIDHSLGQSRRSLYLAVKSFASYVALEYMFEQLGEDTLEQLQASKEAATLCANTVSSYFDEELGYIPSLLDGKDKIATIPAIEGLIYPYMLGKLEYLSVDGGFSDLITKLKTHIKTVLIDKKLCLFNDNGWKISESSINSWVSKIFLNQYIAENVLDIDFKGMEKEFDKAHANWWIVGCPTNPGIDQIFKGTQEERNFHYPRAITSYLFVKGK